MRRLLFAGHGPLFAVLHVQTVYQSSAIVKGSARGFGVGAGGKPPRGTSRLRPPEDPKQPPCSLQETTKGHMNITQDGQLSSATRLAMRDDAVIMAELFKLIPSDGAISLKSLSANVSTDIAEALSEKYGGLHAFLQTRKQFFVVKPRPTDGVLFVAGSALASQRYATRELQRNTMRNILGLNDPERTPGYSRGRGGRPGASRGGTRGPSQSRSPRGSYDTGDNGGDPRNRFRTNNGGPRGGSPHGTDKVAGRSQFQRRHSPPSLRDGGRGGAGDGPMGSQERSFGTRPV